MNINFSILILTYNGAKTISKLLNKLSNLTDNYNKEIIIIDSQSTDHTVKIASRYKKRLNLRIITIKNKDFNHGTTRNMGVRLAKGKYIYFLSQDAIPINKNILKFFFADFQLNKKVVVAVFGKHIPYKNTPLIQKLEVLCRWERLDKCLNKNKLLIQNKQSYDINLYEDNKLDLYILSNTSCCYRRDFLIKNPFPKTSYGEDLKMGKVIIDKGFTKIYDPRCSVLHSHIFSISQYFKREKEDLTLRMLDMRLKNKINFFCKIKKIISMHESFLTKFKYLCLLFFYYFLKFIILLKIWLKL